MERKSLEPWALPFVPSPLLPGSAPRQAQPTPRPWAFASNSSPLTDFTKAVDISAEFPSSSLKFAADAANKEPLPDASCASAPGTSVSQVPFDHGFPQLAAASPNRNAPHSISTPASPDDLQQQLHHETEAILSDFRQTLSHSMAMRESVTRLSLDGDALAANGVLSVDQPFFGAAPSSAPRHPAATPDVPFSARVALANGDMPREKAKIKSLPAFSAAPAGAASAGEASKDPRRSTSKGDVSGEGRMKGPQRKLHWDEDDSAVQPTPRQMPPLPHAAGAPDALSTGPRRRTQTSQQRRRFSADGSNSVRRTPLVVPRRLTLLLPTAATAVVAINGNAQATPQHWPVPAAQVQASAREVQTARELPASRVHPTWSPPSAPPSQQRRVDALFQSSKTGTNIPNAASGSSIGDAFTRTMSNASNPNGNQDAGWGATPGCFTLHSRPTPVATSAFGQQPRSVRDNGPVSSPCYSGQQSPQSHMPFTSDPVSFQLPRQLHANSFSSFAPLRTVGVDAVGGGSSDFHNFSWRDDGASSWPYGGAEGSREGNSGYLPSSFSTEAQDGNERLSAAAAPHGAAVGDEGVDAAADFGWAAAQAQGRGMPPVDGTKQVGSPGTQDRQDLSALLESSPSSVRSAGFTSTLHFSGRDVEDLHSDSDDREFALLYGFADDSGNSVDGSGGRPVTQQAFEADGASDGTGAEEGEEADAEACSMAGEEPLAAPGVTEPQRLWEGRSSHASEDLSDRARDAGIDSNDGAFQAPAEADYVTPAGGQTALTADAPDQSVGDDVFPSKVSSRPMPGSPPAAASEGIARVAVQDQCQDCSTQRGSLAAAALVDSDSDLDSGNETDRSRASLTLSHSSNEAALAGPQHLDCETPTLFGSRSHQHQFAPEPHHASVTPEPRSLAAAVHGSGGGPASVDSKGPDNPLAVVPPSCEMSWASETDRELLDELSRVWGSVASRRQTQETEDSSSATVAPVPESLSVSALARSAGVCRSDGTGKHSAMRPVNLAAAAAQVLSARQHETTSSTTPSSGTFSFPLHAPSAARSGGTATASSGLPSRYGTVRETARGVSPAVSAARDWGYGERPARYGPSGYRSSSSSSEAEGSADSASDRAGGLHPVAGPWLIQENPAFEDDTDTAAASSNLEDDAETILDTSPLRMTTSAASAMKSFKSSDTGRPFGSPSTATTSQRKCLPVTSCDTRLLHAVSPGPSRAVSHVTAPTPTTAMTAAAKATQARASSAGHSSSDSDSPHLSTLNRMAGSAVRGGPGFSVRKLQGQLGLLHRRTDIIKNLYDGRSDGGADDDDDDGDDRRDTAVSRACAGLNLNLGGGVLQLQQHHCAASSAATGILDPHMRAQVVELEHIQAQLLQALAASGEPPMPVPPPPPSPAPAGSAGALCRASNSAPSRCSSGAEVTSPDTDDGMRASNASGVNGAVAINPLVAQVAATAVSKALARVVKIAREHEGLRRLSEQQRDEVSVLRAAELELQARNKHLDAMLVESSRSAERKARTHERRLLKLEAQLAASTQRIRQLERMHTEATLARQQAEQHVADEKGRSAEAARLESEMREQLAVTEAHLQGMLAERAAEAQGAGQSGSALEELEVLRRQVASLEKQLGGEQAAAAERVAAGQAAAAEELEALRRQLADAQAAAESLDAQARVAEKRSGEELETLRTQLARLRERVGVAEAERRVAEEAGGEAEALRRRVQELEQELLAARAAADENRLGMQEAATEEAEELLAACAEAEARAQQLQADLRSTHEAFSRLQDLEQQLRGEVARLAEALRAAEDSAVEQQQLLHDELQAARMAMSELTAERAAARAEALRREDEAQKASMEALTAQRAAEAADAEAVAARAATAELEQRHEVAVAEAEVTTTELRRQVEAAAWEADRLTAEAVQAAQRAAEAEKRERDVQGQLRSAVAETAGLRQQLEEAAAVAVAAEQQAAAVADLEMALVAESARVLQETQRREQLEAAHEAATQRLRTQLADSRAECERLQAALSDFEGTHEASRSQLKRRQQELAACRHQLETLGQERARLVAANAELHDQVAEAAEAADAARGEAHQLRVQLNGAQGAVAERKGTEAELRDRVQALEAEAQVLLARLADEQGDRESLVEKLRQAQAEATEARACVQEARERAEEVERRLVGAEEEQAALAERLGLVQQELEEQDRLAQRQLEDVTLRADNAEMAMEDARRAAEADVVASKRQVEELAAQLQAAQADLALAQTQLEAAAAELTTAKADLGTREAELIAVRRDVEAATIRHQAALAAAEAAGEAAVAVALSEVEVERCKAADLEAEVQEAMRRIVDLQRQVEAASRREAALERQRERLLLRSAVEVVAATPRESMVSESEGTTLASASGGRSVTGGDGDGEDGTQGGSGVGGQRGERGRRQACQVASGRTSCEGTTSPESASVPQSPPDLRLAGAVVAAHAQLSDLQRRQDEAEELIGAQTEELQEARHRCDGLQALLRQREVELEAARAAEQCSEQRLRELQDHLERQEERDAMAAANAGRAPAAPRTHSTSMQHMPPLPPVVAPSPVVGLLTSASVLSPGSSLRVERSSMVFRHSMQSPRLGSFLYGGPGTDGLAGGGGIESYANTSTAAHHHQAMPSRWCSTDRLPSPALLGGGGGMTTGPHSASTATGYSLSPGGDGVSGDWNRGGGTGLIGTGAGAFTSGLIEACDYLAATPLSLWVEPGSVLGAAAEYTLGELTETASREAGFGVSVFARSPDIAAAALAAPYQFPGTAGIQPGAASSPPLPLGALFGGRDTSAPIAALPPAGGQLPAVSAITASGGGGSGGIKLTASLLELRYAMHRVEQVAGELSGLMGAQGRGSADRATIAMPPHPSIVSGSGGGSGSAAGSHRPLNGASSAGGSLRGCNAAEEAAAEAALLERAWLADSLEALTTRAAAVASQLAACLDVAEDMHGEPKTPAPPPSQPLISPLAVRVLESELDDLRRQFEQVERNGERALEQQQAEFAAERSLLCSEMSQYRQLVEQLRLQLASLERAMQGERVERRDREAEVESLQRITRQLASKCEDQEGHIADLRRQLASVAKASSSHYHQHQHTNASATTSASAGAASLQDRDPTRYALHQDWATPASGRQPGETHRSLDDRSYGTPQSEGRTLASPLAGEEEEEAAAVAVGSRGAVAGVGAGVAVRDPPGRRGISEGSSGSCSVDDALGRGRWVPAVGQYRSSDVGGGDHGLGRSLEPSLSARGAAAGTASADDFGCTHSPEPYGAARVSTRPVSSNSAAWELPAHHHHHHAYHHPQPSQPFPPSSALTTNRDRASSSSASDCAHITEDEAKLWVELLHLLAAADRAAERSGERSAADGASARPHAASGAASADAAGSDSYAWLSALLPAPDSVLAPALLTDSQALPDAGSLQLRQPTQLSLSARATRRRFGGREGERDHGGNSLQLAAAAAAATARGRAAMLARAVGALQLVGSQNRQLVRLLRKMRSRVEGSGEGAGAGAAAAAVAAAAATAQLETLRRENQSLAAKYDKALMAQQQSSLALQRLGRENREIYDQLMKLRAERIQHLEVSLKVEGAQPRKEAAEAAGPRQGGDGDGTGQSGAEMASA